MCCGFVGDVVSSVVDVIGDVVEYVVDNALPIIETAALIYFTGPGGLGLTGTNLMVARAVGNAAISAINGGSMASIISAGIMPFVPGALQSVGINFNPTNFVSQAIKDTLGDSFVSTIVSSAAGSAVNAGIMAAVTGDDILEAAKYAGLTGAVSSGISRAWDVAKANSPTLSSIQQTLSDLLPDIEESKPLYQDINDMQTQLEAEAKKYNDMLEKYQPVQSEYETKLSEYNKYKDLNDASSANPIATDLNDNVIPKLQSLNDELSNQYSVYENNKTTFEDYLKTNQADLDRYGAIMETYTDKTKQYNALSTLSLSDYDQARLTSAITAGDFSTAADIQAEIDSFNKSVEGNPYAIASQSSLSDPSQIDLLNKIKNAPDQATKDQLISQAKLNVYFQDMASNALANPSEYEKILPSIEELLAKQNAINNPPTPPTGTGTTGTASNVGNYLTNVGSNLLGNITQGVVTNNILNAILGNDPERPSIPTKARPPSKVDVSTLTPFTGNLPSNVTANVTPEKKDPTNLTPFTGGLPTTGGTTPTTPTPPTTPTTPPTTPPTTNTTTQTPTGGLQSNQTQTPPTKVDVSRLTPVTDINRLKSLGIA